MDRDAIEGLLDEYAAAFDAFDAARIAALYDEPSVIVDGTATSVFPTRAEMQGNAEQLVAAYKGMNYRRARRERTVVARVSELLAFADVAWCIETDGTPVRFTTRYTIAERDGVLRIAAVVVGDEDAAWLDA